MNLPNQLTMLRILMIPVFMVFIELNSLPNHILWAFVVFVLASLTDMLDGNIARKYNLVTDFGKFMDPAGRQDSGNSSLDLLYPAGTGSCMDRDFDSGKGISGYLAETDCFGQGNRHCGR